MKHSFAELVVAVMRVHFHLAAAKLSIARAARHAAAGARLAAGVRQ